MLSKSSDLSAGSPDRFGYEWGEYAEMRPDYEEQFRRWTPSMRPEDWRGLRFLDAGCGMGRNSYWPMSYGAASCLSVDVDPRSLASAQQTLEPFPTAEVAEGSIYDIPPSAEFDIAFSIGVIHHLEQPEAAIKALAGAVKPGGRVLIWVYGLENNRWIVSIVSPLRRRVLARLPIGFLHHLSIYPTVLLWLWLRVQPGRIAYMRLLRGFGFRHLRSIVFDQLLPKIAHYWTCDDVEALMQGAGLRNVEVTWVNEMSWAVAGTK